MIVDIDGTLAHRGDRGPYDWDRVGEDTADEIVLELCEDAIDRGYQLVVVTGRPERCRRQTELWLDAQGLQYSRMWMRADGDSRADTVVKEELYTQWIKKAVPPVRYVIDDRNGVVAMWRRLGLKVLQVAEGNF